MSSLAKTTEKLRTIIKFTAIGGGIIFALYLFFLGGIFVKNIFFPEAPEGPEQAFGELPTIIFEPKASPAIDYQINTTSGNLPTNLPTRMMVYKLEQPKPDLLALQNTRSIASTAGFKEGETRISDIMYQWSNPTTNAIIKFDINKKTFEIRSNIQANQPILANATMPNEDRIKQYVNDFLRSLGVNIDGLSYTDKSFKYYSFINNQLTPLDNSFNAKAVRVSLYNNPITNDFGEFSFVYPNPDFPIVNVLVAFPSISRMIVLEAESYNKIVTDESSEYAIKSPEEALSDLKSGIGYLYNPNSSKNIQITDVYLAYYLGKDTDEYAQPVYVFEGINSKAFVPAAIYSTQSAEVTSE